MLKEFKITLDIKKESISNKINGLNLNDEASIKIKFVQNSLPYVINNKDIRIDYKLPDGVLLFQNENTGVAKVDGNTIDIQVINQALQQVGDVTLDVSIFEKSTSKKITTSKLILKVDSIIYKEEQLSTDFDALQTALNDSKKLESKFGTAKDLDNKLQQDFKTGTALDNTLKEDIKNADTSKSNLDGSITKANNTKNVLESTIATGDKLKQELTPSNYITNEKYSEFEKKTTSQYEETKNNYKYLGINLLKNSDFAQDLKYWVKDDTSSLNESISIKKEQSFNSIDIISYESKKYGIYQNVIIEPNQTYTISFYAKKHNGNRTTLKVGIDKTDIKEIAIDSTDYKRYSVNVKTSSELAGDELGILFFPVRNTDKAYYEISLHHLKMQKGYIVTDWTPALTDDRDLINIQDKRLDVIEQALIEKGILEAKKIIK